MPYQTMPGEGFACSFFFFFYNGTTAKTQLPYMHVMQVGKKREEWEYVEKIGQLYLTEYNTEYKKMFLYSLCIYNT